MINTVEKTKGSTYKLDAEVAVVYAELAKKTAGIPKPERGDWKTLRDNGNAGWKAWANAAPHYLDVKKKTFFTKTLDGASMELRWYTKEGSNPGSAVVYAHGGGMVLGSLDVYDFVVSEYVSKSGVPFLAVDYRLAPESKGTMLTEDVFSGISWLIEHARELGVDLSRIAIMGDSGGGAPTAGAAIMARDRQVSLAQQILIYPMLDDRNLTPDTSILPFLSWTYDNNYTAWSAVLGKEFGSESVSPMIAPARLKDFAGLAPAYVEVGELDIFRDEDIAYAQRLTKAGIPVELHVHTGAPHGYDRIAPTMSNIRHILRLHTQSFGFWEIVKQTGILPAMLRKYIADFKRSGLSFTEINELSDKDIEELFPKPEDKPADEKQQLLYSMFPAMEGKKSSDMFSSWLFQYHGNALPSCGAYRDKASS